MGTKRKFITSAHSVLILIVLVFLVLSARQFVFTDDFGKTLVQGKNKRSKPISTIATVRRIIDGDTIEVNLSGNIEQIRYIGIDTPEFGQDYFKQATDFNSQLLKSGKVCIEEDIRLRDRYNRILAYVWSPKDNCENKKTFVNLEIIKEGYADILTISPDIRYQWLFAGALFNAKKSRRGIWSLSAPPNISADKPMDIYS